MSTQRVMNRLSEWTAISLTHSLAHSLDPSLRCNYNVLPVLNHSADLCVKFSSQLLKRGHFQSPALIFLYLESFNITLKLICRLEMDFSIKMRNLNAFYCISTLK